MAPFIAGMIRPNIRHLKRHGPISGNFHVSDPFDITFQWLLTKNVFMVNSGTAKCKFEGMVHNNHEHSGQCRQYLLQDKMRQVSCESNNLLEIEYPKFVMIIVQVMQN